MSDPASRYTAGGVRHAHLNFGAPGDRRQSANELWLAAPRPRSDGYKGHFLSLSLPYLAEFYGEPQTYKRNADRLPVSQTNLPWLYTSGYRGLKSLTVPLDYYDWREQFIALPTASAPTVDGKLTEPCWDKAGDLFLEQMEEVKAQTYTHLAPKTTESALLRHDEENLYIAYRRRAIPDKRGKTPGPWKAKTKGMDANVWEDDCFEMLFRGPGENVLHLGIAASGATYDAVIKTLIPPGANSQARKRDKPVTDVNWNGDWQSACLMRKEDLSFEVAVPWKTLESLGISRNELWVHVDGKVNIRYPKRPTAFSVRTQVRLSTQSREPKPYTVRLHFADLENHSPGERVFNVKLQGEVMLEDFDLVAEAGGKDRAVVKEFKSVMAVDTVKLELVAATGEMNAATAPIISGLEIVAEQPGPVPALVIGRMSRNKGSGSFILQSEIDKMTEKQRRTAFVDPFYESLDSEDKRRARRGLPPLNASDEKK